MHTPQNVNHRITPAYAGKRSTPSRFPKKQQDHPRLCGEKTLLLSGDDLGVGSPPPMRGKEGDDYAGIAKARITPAYAGKSSLILSHKLIQKDHPRLCGEKLVETSDAEMSEGSPPPMRGKGPAADRCVGATGITPAYAGKRTVKKQKKAFTKDHPRLCGEKVDFVHLCTSAAGSPPPMRGKADMRICPSSATRITPAYAGKRC